MKHIAMPQDLRRQLEAQQVQYRTRLEQLERDRRRQGVALSADFAEQAGERENDEVVDALSVGTQVALTQVDHALQRADAGLWGVCERCGRAIADARLRKMPEATRCTRCASRD